MKSLGKESAAHERLTFEKETKWSAIAGLILIHCFCEHERDNLLL